MVGMLCKYCLSLQNLGYIHPADGILGWKHWISFPQIQETYHPPLWCRPQSQKFIRYTATRNKKLATQEIVFVSSITQWQLRGWPLPWVMVHSISAGTALPQVLCGKKTKREIALDSQGIFLLSIPCNSLFPRNTFTTWKNFQQKEWICLSTFSSFLLYPWIWIGTLMTAPQECLWFSTGFWLVCIHIMKKSGSYSPCTIPCLNARLPEWKRWPPITIKPPWTLPSIIWAICCYGWASIDTTYGWFLHIAQIIQVTKHDRQSKGGPTGSVPARIQEQDSTFTGQKSTLTPQNPPTA